MTQNHKSGAGHVHANPYPDGGKSGGNKPGPDTNKSMSAKPAGKGKPSGMTTRPTAFKK